MEIELDRVVTITTYTQEAAFKHIIEDNSSMCVGYEGARLLIIEMTPESGNQDLKETGVFVQSKDTEKSSRWMKVTTSKAMLDLNPTIFVKE